MNTSSTRLQANAGTKKFLEELDAICDSKNTPDERIKCTSDLLTVGDELFNANTVINERIKKGTFIGGICGTTYIEEEFDGKILNRAVVDLVQQGGTMLGIGLLGYTYIMEKAGVRFRSMAGTSAGAINTLLLAALPEDIYQAESPFHNTLGEKRQAVKSEFLAYLVANKDFSKFLDRGGTLGKVQLWLVKRINKIVPLMSFFKALFVVLIISLSIILYQSLNHFVFNTNNHLTGFQLNTYNFISGTLSILAVLILVIVLILALFRKNLGFNPGETPYDWMKSILETNYVGMHTSDKLMEKKRKESKPKVDKPATTTKTAETISLTKDPRLVFISANLTHNRIVKFPENSTDYWNKDYAGMICPAAFVRASMSLPFIYYAFYPKDCYLQPPPGIQPPVGSVKMLARFVDGGMLSNFPIREFHVPPPEPPAYPTFGVLLGSPRPEPGDDTKSIRAKFFSLSVFKFILSFISTFRNFYDADFLRSHSEFSMLVKAVNTDDFNSLDFGMSFETKKNIFQAGARTAIEQLEQFDWSRYLEVRLGKNDQLQNPSL